VSNDVDTTPRTGRSTRFYVWLVVTIIAAIFVFQNSQEVEVKFFFSTTTIPLIFALLLAVVLGFVAGLAFPRFRRRDD
jgi:uncharacterized integral membrane protein